MAEAIASGWLNDVVGWAGEIARCRNEVVIPETAREFPIIAEARILEESNRRYGTLLLRSHYIEALSPKFGDDMAKTAGDVSASLEQAQKTVGEYLRNLHSADAAAACIKSCNDLSGSARALVLKATQAKTNLVA